MRRTSLETPPTWAFSALEAADATQVVGEVVREAAGGGAAGFVAAKTGLISAGGGRVSVDKGGSSTAAWGLSSFQGGDETPVALRSLAEIVDEPLEWVVEGVILRGEVTLVTGEAGVGKSGFLAGMIANVTRGGRGPRDALRKRIAV